MGFFKSLGRADNKMHKNGVETTVKDIAFSDIRSEVKSEETQTRPAPRVTSSLIEEINDLKKDLSRTANALRESMRLNSNSVAEIEKLTSFMTTAEKNALSLERLQPENNRIKSELEDAQSELSKKTLWAGELESKAMAYKARFEEAYKDLERKNAAVIELQDKLGASTAAHKEYIDALDKYKIERQEFMQMIDDLRGENTALQTQVSSLYEAEKRLARDNAELQKQADILGAQIDDERRSKENAVSDLKTLRLDFSELKADQMETLSRKDKAMHEVESVHQTLSEHRQRNEDRIFALNAAIDGLKAQQKIDDDMRKYDKLEKEKLRNELLGQRSRADGLEARLEKRTEEMHDNRVALGRAKENYDGLNQKFLVLHAEMEVLRRDHKAQSRKLEEYSSISGVAVGQSFYDDGKRKPKTRTPTASKSSGDAATPLKLVKDSGA